MRRSCDEAHGGAGPHPSRHAFEASCRSLVVRNGPSTDWLGRVRALEVPPAAIPSYAERGSATLVVRRARRDGAGGFKALFGSPVCVTAAKRPDLSELSRRLRLHSPRLPRTAGVRVLVERRRVAPAARSSPPGRAAVVGVGLFFGRLEADVDESRTPCGARS